MSESNHSHRRSSNSERVADATARLERAVNDLAKVAGDRAADYVERAAERLQAERLQAEHLQEGSIRRANRPYRRRYQREPAWLWSDRPRSAKLHRDAANGKILGVCAGIANYYGIETWVVRCIAVTGLIFLNWVVFVSYLVTALILDAGPGMDDRARQTVHGYRHRRRQRHERPGSPSPRQHLRDLNASFDAIELRLRRMETHVTSDRYELQRELAKIGASS